MVLYCHVLPRWIVLSECLDCGYVLCASSPFNAALLFTKVVVKKEIM